MHSITQNSFVLFQRKYIGSMMIMNISILIFSIEIGMKLCCKFYDTDKGKTMLMNNVLVISLGHYIFLLLVLATVIIGTDYTRLAHVACVIIFTWQLKIVLQFDGLMVHVYIVWYAIKAQPSSDYFFVMFYLHQCISTFTSRKG